MEQALAGIQLSQEAVPVLDALGRTVVQDQVSRLDLPPFNKSAMDGYALPDEGEGETYRILEIIPAGEVPTQILLPGTATRVLTGAPVPQGAKMVIRQEYTSGDDQTIRIEKPENTSNICLAGEDICKGDVILSGPALLGPLEIANLISCGITETVVFRRLRVAVISTGDEIVDSFEQLGPGRIMNSNGPLLAALCRIHHLELAGCSLIQDEQADIQQALKKALKTVDIVILTGGVSVGRFDYVGPALQESGLKIHFSRVALKPGKPMTFATTRQKAVFALPGNPVSAYLMFHLFVLRATRVLTGRPPDFRCLSLPLAKEFQRKSAERQEYIPARIDTDGTLIPVEFHGSADLPALLQSDGFMMIPQGTTQIKKGAKVDFLALREFET
jgi:molybdopterin molybdotransferase